LIAREVAARLLASTRLTPNPGHGLHCRL